ncbi:MAG: hypothetical protein EHM61_06935 [Acidobacteria bacterium]|nr:MAG: hypothetical protein EHM61_06935 [Acidobacteriota bacterium]
MGKSALQLLIIAIVFAPCLRAEILPLKSYTIADGLAMDQVNAIRQDSRGLLWFGTSDGVSWFDGYQFVTYTTDHGLPDKLVSDVLETRAGHLWLGTSDGVCRLRRGSQKSEDRFERFRPPRGPDIRSVGFQIGRMLEGPDGSIWCGAFQGLFRLTQKRGSWSLQSVDVKFRTEKWSDSFVRDLLFDGAGTLWIAANSGLYRRTPDGVVTRFGTLQGIPEDECFVLESATGGDFWLGANDGVFRLRPTSPGGVRVVARYTVKDGLPSSRVLSLKASRNGRLWVGTVRGLACLDPETNSAVSAASSAGRPGPSTRNQQKQVTIRAYTTAHGLTDPEITALAEDREQNIWLGTDHGGALKISRQGFETFNASTGLPGNRVNLVFQDWAGHVVFQFTVQGKSFAAWDGRSFSPVIIPGSERFDWIGPQGVLQDDKGGWWLATGAEGLWHYAPNPSFKALSGRQPSRRYTERDGLPSLKVFALFQDSRKDIWVSLVTGSRQLARLNKHGRFSTFNIGGMPTAFAEDHAGNVWIGLLGNGIWRYRKGRMTHYSAANGFPAGSIYGLYTDREGQVWAASRVSGAVCIPDPDAEHPRFVSLTTQRGLSSNHARFILQDRKGAFYIGTARGLDRWDPKGGTIRHFTTDDGLAGNLQNVGLLDPTGTLWLGTFLGVSRLVLEDPAQPHAPEVFVRGLRLGGIPWPVDSVGQPVVKDVVVPLDRNTVSIDFAGVSFVPGEVLNYRYRLGGASEWRFLASQRSLDLVGVRPGKYRLELQAVNSVGLESPSPAIVQFTVLAPVWRQWWFVLTGVAVLGLGVFSGVRFRLRRRLEMERVRTRIATDLHDDIGSSLSQISILCEVAVRRLPDDPASAIDSLSQVTVMTRSLVDAMSDIVWAINPARDSLGDLVHRMRRFANDLFADGSVRHRFEASDTEGRIALSNDFRRQVYLIYKECLHNLVRHAAATEATIELRLADGFLEVEIRDNGVGFDLVAADTGGAGLHSLQSRADALGGQLTIDSKPGAGTRVLCRIPVAGTGWRQPLSWRRSKTA